jgi:hypothetical protein
MIKLLSMVLAFAVSLLVGCGGSSAIDLNRVSEIATDAMKTMSNRADINDGEKAIEALREEFELKLNSSRPLVYPESYIAVTSEADGSFKGFNDTDNNHTQSAEEEVLFKIEIDAENNRVLASNPSGSETAESPFSGMMTGMLMGMMMGNLMGRQRSAGVNPANRKTNVQRPARNASKSAPSARSRAGSGSHARGK